MPYTLKEWKALTPLQRQWAVEGLAKARNIKPGKRVLLDSLMIGTIEKEATVLRVHPNTSWDDPSRYPEDSARFPDMQDNVTLVVESDQGRIMEVNVREILRVLNR